MNNERLSQFFINNGLIGVNERISEKEAVQVGAGQGWSGCLHRISNIEVVNKEDESKKYMVKKYVMKYCKNINHTFGRINELFILD